MQHHAWTSVRALFQCCTLLNHHCVAGLMAGLLSMACTVRVCGVERKPAVEGAFSVSVLLLLLFVVGSGANALLL